MDWNELTNSTIEKIFYLDEEFGSGFKNLDPCYHVIELGTVVLKTKSNDFYSISTENLETDAGLFIEQEKMAFATSDSLLNEIRGDEIWSTIKNKRISEIIKYNDFVISKGPKKTVKELCILTIELSFQTGESVYISNAGFTNKNTIEPFLGDILLYKDRKQGKKYKLIIDES